MNLLLYSLDLFGTASFAVSASLLARQKKLDLFGAIIISIITAVGGGTLRDILLQHYPVFWIHDITYLSVIIAASVLTQLLHSFVARFGKLLLVFDAIGLGVFTLIGLRVALGLGVHPLITIIMGTVSAVFGGLVRDVVCNELPLILHRELYATLSLAGGVLFFGLRALGTPFHAASVIAVLTIIIARLLAIRYNLS
jgi:uncharacterized membrane protein YeiH